MNGFLPTSTRLADIQAINPADKPVSMVFHGSLIQLTDSTISPCESHAQVQATILYD